MLVLIKVGEFLTYRYTGNLDTLEKEFSEYTPDHEIICTREGMFYFEVIPKLISKEFIYKKGWYYDRPEIRDLFKNYTRSENEYPKSEFEVEIRRHLSREVDRILGDSEDWGSQRLRRLLSEDIRTMKFIGLPDIIDISKPLEISADCRCFSNGGKFNITPEIIIRFQTTNPDTEIDQEFSKAQCYIITSNNMGQGLPKDRFLDLVKKENNPYLISTGSDLSFDGSRLKSYFKARDKIQDVIWKHLLSRK